MKHSDIANKLARNIFDRFEKDQNPAEAVAMAAYMRNQFRFLGIKAPVRRALTKEWFVNNKLPELGVGIILSDLLWKSQYRELQYFAIELLIWYKKQWPENIIAHFEKMATSKSWWDSVDYIANHLIGPYFMKYPDQTLEITNRWNQSENIWLQRLSLTFQLLYKSKTNRELLEKHIVNLIESEEFFVQKAIGWSLRQYSKSDPDWVLAFIRSNTLKPLSKREALKVVSKQ